MSRLFHEIYGNNKDNGKCKKILDEHVEYCWIAFKAIQFLYRFVGTSILILTGLLRIFTGSRVLPMQAYLTFLDANSSPGYELNYLYHISILILGVCGFSFSDTFFIAIMITSRGHLKVMMQMLKELNSDLLKKEIQSSSSASSSSTASTEDHFLRLKRICQEHQFHIQ